MKNIAKLTTIGFVWMIMALGGGPGVCWAYHIVTPEDETWTSLNTVTKDIQRYAAQHHRLPDKLSDLPLSSHCLNNGWGKPLVYEPQADGTVVLRSVGEYGGKDSDSIRFSIIDPSNNEHNTPSRDDDGGAMHVTFNNLDWQAQGIRKFAAEHHRLPDSLAELKYPASPPSVLISDLKDGWGWPVSYTPQADGTVLLRSGGRSGNQVFSREFTVSGITPKKPTTAPSTEPTKKLKT